MTTLLVSIYAVSGFSALLYQVVWQRWLVYTVGLSTVSVSLIVSGFLAGLGLGYLAGGRIADRCPPRTALAVFAALELGIAVSALASQPLLYGWLPTVGHFGAEAPWTTFLVVLVLMMPPTMLMGASLPVLARSFVLPSALDQSGFIARLYFANTFGGAVSALLTAFVLVPWLGFDGAVRIGAAGNVLCAAAGLALRRRVSTVDVEAGPAVLAAPMDRWAWRGWLAHAFAAGASGIAWEILAFRVIDNVVKPRAGTFAYVLGVFLTGLAFGSLAGDLLRNRLGRRRRAVFLASQVGVYLSMALGIVVLVWAVESWSVLASWREYMAAYDVSNPWSILVLNYGVLPTVLLLVPGALMGFGFSLSQQLLQTSLSAVGWRLGRVQFVNVLGCVAGGLGTALVAIPAVGTAATVRGVALVGLAYALVWCWEARASAPVVAVVALGAAVAALPSTTTLWTVVAGHDARRMFVREDASGVSSIRFIGDGAAYVFSNGLGQSALPRTADVVHVKLGAIPMLVHPSPTRIGIVGLGSGGTAWAAGARPESSTQIVWELMAGQTALLRDYARFTGVEAADWFARDRRVHIEHADGRHALQTRPDLFDIIEADALRPRSGYSGNLYSVEFFSLVRSRLAPGGLAATWIPTPRVLRTFREVFPHVVVVDGLVALGSDRPMTTDWPTILARLRAPGVLDRFVQSGLDLEAILEPAFATADTLPPVARQGSGDTLNTDMRPRDELPFLGRGVRPAEPTPAH